MTAATMTATVNGEGLVAHYGGVPCVVEDSVHNGYVNVTLLRDPGHGSMYQPCTAPGNVQWRRPEDTSDNGSLPLPSVKKGAEALQPTSPFMRAALIVPRDVIEVDGQPWRVVEGKTGPKTRRLTLRHARTRRLRTIRPAREKRLRLLEAHTG